MIYFTYEHVTRNNGFEAYIEKHLNELLGEDCKDCHINVKLYRIFNHKNVVKESIELKATINNVIYTTTASMSTFKSSFNKAHGQLQVQVQNNVAA